MKRLKTIFLLALLLPVCVKAQLSGPISTAQSYVNTNITTNGGAQITGQKLNQALIYLINALKYIDTSAQGMATRRLLADSIAKVRTDLAGGGGTLAGDVIGAAGSNTVQKIQGRTIATTAPTTGQALVFNGTLWAPATIASGGTQTLSIAGSQLSISGGNTVTLPTSTGTGTGGNETYSRLYTAGTPVTAPNVAVDYTYPSGASRFALPNGEGVLQVVVNGMLLGKDANGYMSTADSLITAFPLNNAKMELVTKSVYKIAPLVFENTQGLTYTSGTYTASSNDGNFTTNHAGLSTKNANLSGVKARISMLFDGTTRNAVLGFSTTAAYAGKTGMIAGFWFDASGITRIVANGATPSVPLLFPAVGSQVFLTHYADGSWEMQVNEGDGQGYRSYVYPFPASSSTATVYPVLSVEGSTAGIAKNLKIEFLP